ncbi:hypothetical protein EWM62_16695 [Mucilaginibacter terrigena]|uniref:TonB-dependent receptor plug domain-containing protein n=1 Tax=Mucilaginibacter terrigena TaxID=2492395 RepID=A0A4Q5LI21_9SPHI|nr:hypothetical protein [Mucilaginibacter terrigena]RYU87348.1 hypothetical protein EWM62_16695 [Mucilaginibacter terrigena]
MNRFFTRLIFASALLLCGHICIGQNIGRLVNYQLQHYPHEKIYIHYDKSSYVSGDTVWFKAYLFTGSQRSRAGKNFYMELLDENGKLLNRLTAPIFESTASGNMVLPTDTAIHAIYCRAYTEAMLKSDSSFVYMKQLSVVNLIKLPPVNAPAPVIHFLPEGGDWINGLPCLMAFKVTDANGMPVTAGGVIRNNGNVVAEFSTVHDGMGTFVMIPQPNQAYTAIWKTADGTEHTTPLPPAKPGGISLHIADVAEGKKYLIFRTGNAAGADKQLTLVAHCSGNIAYMVKIDLSGAEMANGVIPVKDIPSGILNITVFDKNSAPVAERITFVNNHDYSFKADTVFTSINKQNRRLNQITLSVKDSIRSNYSVSVTDADVDTPLANRDNIITHLLLTGDLRGKIVNPYYYFTDTTPKAAQELDLVMLTHGWRKYNWGTDTTQKLTDTIPDHRFLSISGKVSGIKANGFKTGTYATIFVETPDKSTVMLPLQVSENAGFFRDGLIYYGDAKLYFKFQDKNLASDKVKLSVDNGLVKKYIYPFIKPAPDTALAAGTQPVQLSQRVQEYMLQLKNTRQLKEVSISGKAVTKNEKVDKVYTSGVFKDGISTNILVGDDPKATNYVSLFQYLQGKVPGMTISNPLGNEPSVLWRNDGVAFFLNNFASSAGDIRNTPMMDIDYIKIYDPSMGGAFGAFGGVISVYTKRGKGFVYNDKNNKTLPLAGYTPVTDFFSPDYATAVTVTGKPDLRTTLYWEPNIILDKEKQEHLIKFYNNDISRRFKIVIEGMNFDGKLVHLEKIL